MLLGASVACKCALPLFFSVACGHFQQHERVHRTRTGEEPTGGCLASTHASLACLYPPLAALCAAISRLALSVIAPRAMFCLFPAHSISLHYPICTPTILSYPSLQTGFASGASLGLGAGAIYGTASNLRYRNDGRMLLAMSCRAASSSILLNALMLLMFFVSSFSTLA